MPTTPAEPEPKQPPVSNQPVAQKLDPIEKPSAAKVIRKLGSAFTPSIKDALSGSIQDRKALEETQKTIFSQYNENEFEPFSPEQLEVKWKEYRDKCNDRPSLCAALASVPEIINGNKLVLKVGNSVQEEDIRLEKPEMVTWLRRELRNSGIELVTKLEKVESERMIFSDSEKLQMMLQKNPELYQLKQKFNLDFSN